MAMAASAGFGNFVAVEGLVTPGDATSTASDILAAEGTSASGSWLCTWWSCSTS